LINQDVILQQTEPGVVKIKNLEKYLEAQLRRSKGRETYFTSLAQQQITTDLRPQQKKTDLDKTTNFSSVLSQAEKCSGNQTKFARLGLQQIQ
jgi:hypothetical protein